MAGDWGLLEPLRPTFDRLAEAGRQRAALVARVEELLPGATEAGEGVLVTQYAGGGWEVRRSPHINAGTIVVLEVPEWEPPEVRLDPVDFPRPALPAHRLFPGRNSPIA